MANELKDLVESAGRAVAEGVGKYPGKSFEQAEHDLQADFHWNRGQSRLLWEQARDAVRAAFVRRQGVS